METTFKPTGVCAKAIDFSVEGGILTNVTFHGGCPGNHIGIESLVKGMNIDDVILRLKGITCGNRKTSCPDQLACALEAYKKSK